jgi:hypothetical protein
VDADESISEHTLVSADAMRTYAALTSADVSGDRLLGALGGLTDLADRLGGESVRPRTLGELLGPEVGFVTLADKPGSGRTVGLVVRYSAFERGVERVAPEAFESFAEPGRVKFVIAFTLDAQGGDRTFLTCEVRIRATDDDTRSTLRSTWFFAGRAARMLVRRLLELVRSAAESGAERAQGGDRAGDHDDAEHLHAG